MSLWRSCLLIGIYIYQCEHTIAVARLLLARMLFSFRLLAGMLFSFPTSSPAHSAGCKRSVEVAGWNNGSREQQMSHSQIFLFNLFSFFFLFFWWWFCERPLVLPFTFSRTLMPHLLVTSKITTLKAYVKDSMTSAHERTQTEWHVYRVQQHKHNVQMHSVTQGT